MSNKNSPVDKDLSRRVFRILGLGTAGGAALAACQADTGGDGGADSEGEPDPEETAVSNPERIFHGAWPFEAPPTGHFNFAPGVTGLIDLGPGSYFHLLMSPGWSVGLGRRGVALSACRQCRVHREPVRLQHHRRSCLVRWQ